MGLNREVGASSGVGSRACRTARGMSWHHVTFLLYMTPVQHEPAALCVPQQPLSDPHSFAPQMLACAVRSLATHRIPAGDTCSTSACSLVPSAATPP